MKIELCKNCGRSKDMHTNLESVGMGECYEEVGFDFEKGQPIFCSCKEFKKK